MSGYEDGLGRVIEDVVRPAAPAIDANGTFPRAAVSALGDAGILGLTVAKSMGGGGSGLREATDVIQRLSGVCGSTAMIVLMHYAGTVLIENHGPEEVRKALGAG
jgi:alkylation response protein AidB-like acyl-CoA dehydrogenase